MKRTEIDLTGSRSEISSGIPIWEKANLTLTEAAELYNIGVHRLKARLSCSLETNV